MRSIKVNDYELTDAQAPVSARDFTLDVGWLVPVRLDVQPPAECLEALKVTTGSFSLFVDAGQTTEAAGESALCDRLVAMPRHGTLSWTDSTGQEWRVPEAQLLAVPHRYQGVLWLVSVTWSGRALVKVTSNFWDLVTTNWEDMTNNWETYG
jgi:hypothetical protein